VYLTLNERQAPFNDPRVRLAFAHALDKHALARDAFNSFARPTDAMVPPGMGFASRLHGAGYDPGLARRLLAEAGYPGGRGLPTITYPVDQDAQSVVVADTLANQWRRVLGVQIRTVQYSHSSYLALLTNLQYQLAVIDWTDDYPDPQNFLSQQLHSNVPNNNGGWSNASFDRLVDRADHLSADNPHRQALYQQAEDLAMSQAATIPLVNPDAGILVRSDVHGLQISGGYVLVKDWSKVRTGSSA
jgi:ABC-type oligopeptide transport system substrate-binding subunit